MRVNIKMAQFITRYFQLLYVVIDMLVCRYHWRQFAVVTSDIAGHDDFVQAVREEVGRMREELSIK